MEERELLDLGLDRQADEVGEGAVAPSLLELVFIFRVLGFADQEVAPAPV